MDIKHKVLTFFYGSYINFSVLKEVDLIPDKWAVAVLHGYDISIKPLANVFPSDKDSVYGILTSVSHEELKRLYHHAEHILGSIYLPEAVLTATLDGKWVPAMCYISHDMKEHKASNDYVDRILNPAREFQFPQWYLSRIESFKR
jgi:hypothetical protein